MKESDIKSRLEDLFNNSLSPTELEELATLVEREGVDLSDMDSMAGLCNMIGIDPEIPLSSDMDNRFYSMLEEAKIAGSNDASRKISIRHAFRIAAGIALFITGWVTAGLTGNQGNSEVVARLSDEVSGLKETLVLTMLQQDSPAGRIEAVYMAGEMESIDSKIIDGLLAVLNNDPNDNVRFMALETLVEYSDNPSVIEGIVKSIRYQDSPVLQLRMAEIMVMLEEKRSVPEFQKILEDITLDYGIRTRLTETVEVLL